MKHFIYNFTGSLELTNDQLSTSVASYLSWLERHLYREVTGSNSVEVLTFSGYYTRLLKCLYNCDDQSLLDNNSLIQRLDPFLQNGILRVGGRLRCADLPHKTKHPAIGKVMSLRYSFVTLINGCHAGRGHVISNLRERCWITKVNTAVRHVISKCVFCRRSYPRPSAQKMADLPKNRISPATPFTYTGVDYFGPFIIKEARKEVKGYHKEKSRWINERIWSLLI